MCCKCTEACVTYLSQDINVTTNNTVMVEPTNGSKLMLSSGRKQGHEQGLCTKLYFKCGAGLPLLGPKEVMVESDELVCRGGRMNE